MNASCEHFSEYFKDFGPTAFNIIHGIFSACVSQEARRQKVSFVGKTPNCYLYGTVGVREYVWKIQSENHYRGRRHFLLTLRLTTIGESPKQKKITHQLFHFPICCSSVGHIMSMLHMRQLWTAALLLFTLYILRMQRPAHSRSFRN